MQQLVHGEHRAERRQAQHHVVGAARVAHQAEAPDLAGERPKARTDLNIELFVQTLTHFSIIDALWNLYRIDHRRPNRLGHCGLKFQLVHFTNEGFMNLPVTLPTRFEPLFKDDTERFMQCIIHRDRRRMMVDALAAPVFLNHR